MSTINQQIRIYMQNHGEGAGNIFTWFFISIGMAYDFLAIRASTASHETWSWMNENAGAISIVGMIISIGLAEYHRRNPKERRKGE